jgi:hypothetical protein
MSGPKRLPKNAWQAALSMQLTRRAIEEGCHARRLACASAIRASCVPFALVDNSVSWRR